VDPNVITAAAKSPLGILALIILALAGIATAYFRQSPVNVRVSMFVLMLLGAGLFAATVLKQPSAPAPAAPTTGTPATGNTAPPPATPPSVPAAAVSQAGGSPSAAGQVLPESSDRPLQPAEIAGLSVAELRLARNEIYARHGYIFQSPDLRAHFAQFAWYSPTQTTVELNPVERENVALLKRAEAERGGG
jgi:hypothetical protein